jgi:hypothetical protein
MLNSGSREKTIGFAALDVPAKSNAFSRFLGEGVATNGSISINN